MGAQDTTTYDVTPNGDTEGAAQSVSAPAHDHAGFSVVFSLTGRVNITDSQWLHDLLEVQSAQAPERLVVDLSRVPSMDWWVAVMLGWARRAAGRRGVTLELASPQPDVARILDATADPDGQ